MITMIAAAVLAAQPTTPAPAAPPMQHDMHMKMDQQMDHKGMNCCKECCDHMNAQHRSEQTDHGTHQQ
jgi:hypothetical protein